MINPNDEEVLIAFRLQSEFGLSFASSKILGVFILVLIAFRLQSEFGHYLKETSKNDAVIVLIAFRLQSEFGLPHYPLPHVHLLHVVS